MSKSQKLSGMKRRGGTAIQTLTCIPGLAYLNTFSFAFYSGTVCPKHTGHNSEYCLESLRCLCDSVHNIWSVLRAKPQALVSAFML